MSSSFTRAFALDDISIRSGGDGRTVEAYAAVFDIPTEIQDQHGHYSEQIGRNAFNRTVEQRGTRFGVFYNHGRTLQGTPSERGSMPLGSPIEAPKADGRGLITVTRYNKTQQADEVLEAIRNGDIRGQSFSGRFIGSDKPTPRGGFTPDGRTGALQLVTRTEIAMTEYGPTPIPAYDEPMLIGVRSRQEIARRASQLNRVRDHFSRATLAPAETQTLTFLLAQLAAADAGIDPIVDALCAADCALDAAQMVVAAMLSVPDPDMDDDEGEQGEPAMASASGPRSQTIGALTPAQPGPSAPTGTGTTPPAAEGSRLAHPGRSAAARARALAHPFLLEMSA